MSLAEIIVSDATVSGGTNGPFCPQAQTRQVVSSIKIAFFMALICALGFVKRELYCLK